ncbi:mannonate dehydratase [Urbifossiella limnaea]|uniref:mannonate dehydratase n=1 Tax=Urbifossiella limnaea TaxID=2528023 RepID=A0A517XNY4_9BACT|nr:mannonate dehydratase [Urbifossiella limnaea]QDU19220.1 Mannonate dehydratase [Urbifossiella limnaea]
MRLATVLTPMSDENLQLAAQCGVTDIVHRYADAATLRASRQRIASFGMTLSVVEGYLPIEAIKLGADDGRELRLLKTLVRDMAELDVRLLCYNFMAGTDWVRTRLDAPERGGAKVTAFDLTAADAAVRLGYTPADVRADELARQLSPAKLWDHLERLLNELLPVAESCGVTLAMHPDDPPLPALLGKPRIMHTVEAFERLVRLAPTPANAVCFCQGSFAAMGVDIPAAIRRLGPHIKYVHFRDVRGTAESFAETFHDNGPTDMAAAMRAYREAGFAGPMRPDHVPQLVGEDDGEPGYTMLGRLFAFGYIRGLMHATA